MMLVLSFCCYLLARKGAEWFIAEEDAAQQAACQPPEPTKPE